ncbi:MAG: zinc-ribbon domain-containing protein [Promethearchaeota archaeon]|jgi:predicted amidophosphoribosyltransferase
MICQNCGQKLDDSAIYCEQCGVKVGKENATEIFNEYDVLFRYHELEYEYIKSSESTTASVPKSV